MTWTRRKACAAVLGAAAAAIAGTAATASAATASTHATATRASTPPASPHLASPQATATPQPGGASFPWSNLITAASTLTAGLGGIWLKDKLDIKRDRGQRRRDAYAALLLSLDELARVIGAPHTVGGELQAGALRQVIAQTTGTIQRSYYAVYLVGSPGVQTAARNAWQAAWDIHDWATTDQPNDGRPGIEQLEDLRGKLREAGSAFAQSVRNETIRNETIG